MMKFSHRCTCCLKPSECATTIKLDSSGHFLWSADFYRTSGDTSVTTQTYQCDSDSSGSVYQVGDKSTATDETPAYTLQSWDSSGAFRWGWAPDGVNYLFGCRVGPNVTESSTTSQMVIVGTIGIGSAASTSAWALDTNGAVLWSSTIPYPCVLHSVGTNRSLWRVTNWPVGGSPLPTYPATGWILISNIDGSVVFTSWNSALALTPTPCNYWTRLAAIDSTDLVYEVSCFSVAYDVSTGDQVDSTVVSRYSSDGASIDWSYGSRYMSGDRTNYGGVCSMAYNAPLGSILVDGIVCSSDYHNTANLNNYPNQFAYGDIVLDGDGSTLLISTVSGMERISKGSGGHLDAFCNGATNLLFANQTLDCISGIFEQSYNRWSLGLGAAGGVTPIYHADGSRNLLWAYPLNDVPGFPEISVADGRLTSDGSSIWSIGRTCTPLTIQPAPDPRTPDPPRCGGSEVEFGANTNADDQSGYEWDLIAEGCAEGCHNPLNVTFLQWVTQSDTYADYCHAFATGDIATNYGGGGIDTVVQPKIFPLATLGGTFTIQCLSCGSYSPYDDQSGCSGLVIWTWDSELNQWVDEESCSGTVGGTPCQAGEPNLPVPLPDGYPTTITIECTPGGTFLTDEGGTGGCTGSVAFAWQSSISTWIQVAGSCLTGCSVTAPLIAGTTNGQLAYVNCSP